jgi:hypothetical protein
MALTPATLSRPSVFAVLLSTVALYFCGILHGNPLETLSSKDRSVENWGIEEGLPNSSVSSVVQTPDGYLWVGTWNGLARFDGVRFTNFSPVNTPQLTHARVVNLERGPLDQHLRRIAHVLQRRYLHPRAHRRTRYPL